MRLAKLYEAANDKVTISKHNGLSLVCNPNYKDDFNVLNNKGYLDQDYHILNGQVHYGTTAYADLNQDDMAELIKKLQADYKLVQQFQKDLDAYNAKK